MRRLAARQVGAGMIAAVLTMLAYDTGAATFTVNSTADTSDAACTTGAGGCTLREAMDAAVATPGRDTIVFDPAVFPPGAPGVISLFQVTPVIVDAAGTVLDGAGAGVVIQAANQIGPSPDPLVFASGAGVPLANVTVANVTVRTFLGSGIVVCGGEFPTCDQDVAGTVVRNVVATGNEGSGVKIAGRAVTKTQILDTVATENGATGIECTASQSLVGTRVDGCAARHNGGIGIELHASARAVGNVVVDSVAVRNGSFGIEVAAAESVAKTKLTNVSATFNGDIGILVDSNHATATLIAKARATNNVGNGIFLENSTANNTLKDVVANGNFEGIVVAGTPLTGAKITNATAARNQHDGIGLSSDGDVIGITVTHAFTVANGQNGLEIRGATATSNVLRQIRSSGNAGEGIRIDASGGTGNLIEKSSAMANKTFGIFVQDGNTGNVIQKNVALNSDGANLVDANVACVNSWKKNVFATRAGPCIQ